MWLDSSSGTQQLYVAPSDSGVVEDPTEPPPPPPPPPVSEPPPTPTPTPTPPSCPAVKFIGVRGSLELAGLGGPVGALAQSLQDKKVLDKVATAAITYPAAIFPEVTIDGWQLKVGDLRTYYESVSAGTEALDSVLANDPCRPRTRYVLAGYSQGAHVIGNVLSSGLSRNTRQRISAVVLFGDPKFNPDDPRFTRRGSAKGNQYGGLLGPRAKGSITGTKNDYPLLTYCRDRDPYCQGRLKVFGGFGLPIANPDVDPITKPRAHERYGEYADDAASRITKLLKRSAQ